MLKTITFNVLDKGSLDVQYQEEGGPAYSFDPAQLPAKLDALLPDVLKAAMVRVSELEAELESFKK